MKKNGFALLILRSTGQLLYWISWHKETRHRFQLPDSPIPSTWPEGRSNRPMQFTSSAFHRIKSPSLSFSCLDWGKQPQSLGLHACLQMSPKFPALSKHGLQGGSFQQLSTWMTPYWCQIGACYRLYWEQMFSYELTNQTLYFSVHTSFRLLWKASQ